MPDFDTIHIKKINVGGTEFPIDASYLEGHTWAEIQQAIEAAFTAYTSWSSDDYALANPSQAYFESKIVNVPYGVKLFWDNGNKPTSEAARPSYSVGTLTAANADHNKIYLVCVGSGDKQKYDEYITSEVISGGVTSWQWERLGSTDVDLSNYPTKDVAGKAGTYTSSTSSITVTGSAGGGSATGTATVTLPTTTITSQSNSGSTTATVNTSSAGGEVISGSYYGFSGNTVTLTATGSADVWIHKHVYQPAGSISGSTVVPAHSHSISPSKNTTTVVSGITKANSAGGHTHTIDTHSHGTPVSGITGLNTTTVKAFKTGGSASLSTKNWGFSSSITTGIMYSPTVSNSGVLSWSTANASTQDALSFTAATGEDVTVASPTPAGTQLFAISQEAVTLTSSSAGSHTHGIDFSTTSITYVSDATITGNNSSFTVYGSNFAFTGTTATLTHVPQGSPTTTTDELLTVEHVSASVKYTPSGTITGGYTISAHTHSVTYQAPANHTHSVTIAQQSLTGTASVAISNHTHTMGHTHTVTVANCSDA